MPPKPERKEPPKPERKEPPKPERKEPPKPERKVRTVPIQYKGKEIYIPFINFTIYKILGEEGFEILDLPIEELITEEMINKNYRKQALVYHPDKPTGDSSKFVILGNAKKKALDIIKEIKESRMKYQK